MRQIRTKKKLLSAAPKQPPLCLIVYRSPGSLAHSRSTDDRHSALGGGLDPEMQLMEANARTICGRTQTNIAFTQSGTNLGAYLSVILKKKTMTTVNAETWRPRDNFLAECDERSSDKITRNRGNGTMGWKWDESQSCSLSVTTTQIHSKAELKLRCSLL